jgi:5-methylcytosine-specific restriction protein A
VHHITPPKGDEELFFDRNNLTVLCESCHARMTSAEAKEAKHGKR